MFGVLVEHVRFVLSKNVISSRKLSHSNVLKYGKLSNYPTKCRVYWKHCVRVTFFGNKIRMFTLTERRTRFMHI